jgi:hypothetical protein
MQRNSWYAAVAAMLVVRFRARSSLGLAALVLFAPSLSCAESGSTPQTSGALEVRVSIQHSDGREARGIRQAEPVRLSVTVRNRSDEPRSLTLPTSQTYDFAVVGEAGREVWRWSAGRMFAQMLTEVALAPGESKTFSETWDQLCSDGRPAAAGAYRLVGSVPALAGPVVSTEVGFEIE